MNICVLITDTNGNNSCVDISNSEITDKPANKRRSSKYRICIVLCVWVCVIFVLRGTIVPRAKYRRSEAIPRLLYAKHCLRKSVNHRISITAGPTNL